MKNNHFDTLILGCGEGGKFMAWSLAKKGQKVAVIERRWIGGSCPNVACLPSKNIVHSAKVASLFFRSEEFGITKDNTKIHMDAVRERKRQMVKGLIDLHCDIFKQTGAELIWGEGKFIAPKIIEVTNNEGNKQVYTADKVVLDLGSRAKIGDVPGMAEAKPMTNIELLELDQIPAHLIIVGGGYVGLEFAQAMRRFGSEVTVIEHGERLLKREDEDVSGAVENLFRDEGIHLATKSSISRIKGVSGQKVKVYLTDGREIEGTHLLEAIGRIPNTEGIGLEKTGVELTPKGYVKVNDRLETTALNIWALGDCAGSPHFTHISYEDYRIIFDNLFGGNRSALGRQVPSCMFIDPELARIGLTENEAKEKGLTYHVAKIPMKSVLRTRTLSETRGFMKALICSKTNQILGFTAFGAGAGELMGTVQVAMLANLPYTTLKDATFAHPTLTEGLNVLFSSLPEPSRVTGN